MLYIPLPFFRCIGRAAFFVFNYLIWIKDILTKKYKNKTSLSLEEEKN